LLEWSLEVSRTRVGLPNLLIRDEPASAIPSFVQWKAPKTRTLV